MVWMTTRNRIRFPMSDLPLLGCVWWVASDVIRLEGCSAREAEQNWRAPKIPASTPPTVQIQGWAGTCLLHSKYELYYSLAFTSILAATPSSQEERTMWYSHSIRTIIGVCQLVGCILRVRFSTHTTVYQWKKRTLSSNSPSGLCGWLSTVWLPPHI